MSTHNFQDSLKFANSYNNYADRLYRKVFGGTCEVIRDKKTQLLGADVKVKTANRNYFIEEKIRRLYYDDFFLEYWSSIEKLSPGWIAKDQICDYVSYICIQNETVELLPFPLLKNAWERKGDVWKSIYPIKNILNVGDCSQYTTVGVCVPRKIVREEISRIYQKAKS
jgi:hypothetical protein